MTVLVEDPMPIIFIGIVVEAILAACLIGTRRGVLLWPMAGVLVLVLLGVVVERIVVTEVERVEATLDGLAAALEANDWDRAQQYLSRSAVQSRHRAQWALGRIEVLKTKIRNLEITINDLTSPPTAKAKFTGTISYNDRKGEWPYHNYFSTFILELRLEGDRWMITGHSEDGLRR